MGVLTRIAFNGKNQQFLSNSLIFSQPDFCVSRFLRASLHQTLKCDCREIPPGGHVDPEGFVVEP